MLIISSIFIRVKVKFGLIKEADYEREGKGNFRQDFIY